MKRTFAAALMSLLVVAIALLAGVSLAAAETITAQQYHKEKGPCACPDDKDAAGKKCGKRSAFCKAGGVEISNCYLKDVEKRKKDACG
jgi:hypothetical protein